jgi:hypothetical protein
MTLRTWSSNFGLCSASVLASLLHDADSAAFDLELKPD